MMPDNILYPNRAYPDILYPKPYVNNYGAKAGLLQYVKERLPEIPQMPFVVKRPKDDIEKIIKQADDVGIGWPRLIRSSAVEELYGYEGRFPTKVMESLEEERAAYREANQGELIKYLTPESHKNSLRELIRMIEDSPTLKNIASENGIPVSKKINVMITQKYNSNFRGTFVEHPNQNGALIFSLQDFRHDKVNLAYSYKEGTLAHLGWCMLNSEEDKELCKVISKQLCTVASWYEKIKSLPEMDKDWSYQIEFGINPELKQSNHECLFQVRPFRKKEYASFALPKMFYDNDIIVFGITPPEGINVRMQNSIRSKGAFADISDNVLRGFSGDLHRVMDYGYTKSITRIPNIRAVLFGYSLGLLAHSDISLARKVPLVAYSISGTLTEYAKEEGMFNIISDGNRIRIEER